VIESFDRLASALQRHGEIANQLRESGWILARERVQLSGLAA
jgi:hypothetical protein